MAHPPYQQRWLYDATGAATFLGRQPYNSAAGRGTIYVIDRTAAASARGAAFRVLAFAPDGKNRWSRTYSYQARRVEQTRADSLWREVQRRFRGSEHSEADIRRELFLPEFYPPIASAFAGSDGGLWLRREESTQPNVTYLVVGPDGAPKATLTVPLGLILLAADGSRVWGVQKDQYDVPTLRRFRVEAVR